MTKKQPSTTAHASCVALHSQDEQTDGRTTIAKRIVLCLFALVLCVGLMPSFAWAAEDETSTDADEVSDADPSLESLDVQTLDVQTLAADEESEASEDEFSEISEVSDEGNSDIVLLADDDANENDENNTGEEANEPDDSNNSGITTLAATDGEANVYNAEKTSTLLDNLVERFSKGGRNASINNDTVYAAIGLRALNLGSQIDKDEVQKNFDEYYLSETGEISTGTLAKYIIALTDAGVNCTDVTEKMVIDEATGETEEYSLDLVNAMERLLNEDTLDIYSAVWVLSAYECGPYEQKSSGSDENIMSIDDIVAFILEHHNDEGLFGDEKYGYDTQTTAQAMLALFPYADEIEAVDSSLEDAVKALKEFQNEDGGFGYSSEYRDSSIDATANIVAALIALGYDETEDSEFITENGSSPIGYLVAEADEDLDGYANNESVWDEAMTSSTVLMALAAERGYQEEGDSAFDVYDPLGTDYFSNGSDNGYGGTVMAGNSSTSAPAATSSAGLGSGSGSGSSLAQTGDDPTVAIVTGAIALCALAVALIAIRRIRMYQA